MPQILSVRRLLRCLVALLPLLVLAPAFATVPAGYMLISGTNSPLDSNGVAAANASLCFAPVSSTGIPISYRVSGGGQSTKSQVCAQVTSGAFSILIPDTALTSPVNVCFNVTAIDNVSGDSILGPGYGCVQPAGSGSAVTGSQAWCVAGVGGAGGTCNFDNYTPNLAPMVQVQTGPAGATGAAGVSSLAQLAAVRAATPGGTALNMFDKSAATSGSYVNGTTGLPVVQASWTYSGYIVANSGGTMITSASIANGVAGYAFYDQALTFISGTNTTVSAGGTITVPATAAYVRISMLTTAVATEMLVNGATLPNAYVRFTPLSQADINAAGGSAQNNVAAHFTDGQNLYNNQGLSVGVLKCADGTTDSSFSTFRTSNFMYVYGAGFVTSNTSWPTASGLYGFAFYDGNQAYLSGTCATQTTPTPIAVPAAAVYARFYEAVASSNAVVVVAGSSLPANYVGYGYSPQYTAALDANIQQVVNSALPANRNLFDQTRVTTGFELTVATGALASSVNASTSDFLPVQPGMTYNFMVAGGSVAPTFGMAYYDGYKGYIAPGPGLPITAGQVITVPAGVAYLRFCQPTSLNSVQVVTIGSTPPTNYIPFYSSGATTSTSYGKKMAWWGDSITALYGSSWQPTVVTRSGILTAFQDAHAGRSFAPASAFENYGGTCSGINLGAGGPMPNTGILGNTIAQDLAGIDGIVVELGTNDYTKTLGSPGDATTAATVYGYIRNFVECVLAAAPNIHMVMISPYNSSGRGGAGTLGVVNAIKYVAAQNSVPVIDTYNEGGINQFNWSTTIMVDGIHVTALGGSLYYGPQIAERVKRMF